MGFLFMRHLGRRGLDRVRLKFLCAKKATFLGQRYAFAVLRAPGFPLAGSEGALGTMPWEEWRCGRGSEGQGAGARDRRETLLGMVMRWWPAACGPVSFMHCKAPCKPPICSQGGYANDPAWWFLGIRKGLEREVSGLQNDGKFARADHQEISRGWATQVGVGDNQKLLGRCSESTESLYLDLEGCKRCGNLGCSSSSPVFFININCSKPSWFL